MMRHILQLAWVLLFCLGLCACSSTTWNVRAYDLSGKEVYQGTLVEKWNGEVLTPAGKKVVLRNATVVFEEK